MFPSFFFALKRAQVPVTLREYLTLMEAMAAGVRGLRGRALLLPGTRLPGEG